MDGIFGIGPLELVLIAVIALIVLGPERLPSALREGGRYLREIRKLGHELTSQFSDELNMLDDLNPRGLINEILDPITQAPKPAPKAPPVQPQKPTEAIPPGAAAATPVAADAAVSGTNGASDGNVATLDGPANSILPPKPTAAPAPAEASAPQPEPATSVDSRAAPPPETPA